MTREEAIKVLQREKDYVQQAIQRETDGSGYVSPDGLIRADDYAEACTVAISALRAQQTIHVTDLYDEDGGEVYRTKQEHFRYGTKKVEPLTLDELRKMDGEPVWIEPNDSCPPHWRIWSNSEPFDVAVFKAYRRKPDERTV